MREIRLTYQLPDEAVAKLSGRHITDDSYDELISGEDVTVYKPDGTVLMKYIHDVLPASECRPAYHALRKVARQTDNRWSAAGSNAPGQVVQQAIVKRNGKISKATRAPIVYSGVAGFFDRYTRIPYCRMTAFNLNEPDKFSEALPFIMRVDATFKEHMPERHASQMEVVRRTHPDFYIHGTAFTTITVNRNYRTSVHQDAGDLRQGFGVMAALRAGDFRGGYTVFPAFRVAVDMRNGGVCLADVHEWHGNTAISGMPGKYERVSCVFYYRENMVKCLSAREELEHAKKRKKGDPLY